ncbi:MAG: helix-turn-helix transcriptional regulator [Bacteroidota bacterium]
MRILRQSKEFSQEELAIDSNLDRSYISQLEGGRIVPSLTTLTKLAISLNISVGELVDFKLEHHVEPPQLKRSKKKF